MAQWWRIHQQCRTLGFDPWIRKIPWRRKWQPTPVFLPGKFHGQRSLAGYSPWSCKELDTVEQPRQHTKKQRHYFANKCPYSQSYGFSSSPVWMWDLDHKEGWGQKNWCFRTVVLEKSLEGPLDSKEIKLVSPKENQPWIFIWRTGAEAEAPIPWPPDVKSWLTEKDPDAGEDWGQEEKGATEDEMVGRHRWLNGHEFESTPGVGDKQPCLACWSPCSCKKSDRTEWLNWLIEWVSSEWPNAMF